MFFWPDDWFEEVIDDSDKAGWMDNEAGFEIFLVSPVHHLVETPQPGQRRLIRRGQSVVEVDETVVDIDILVQCQHQVPVRAKKTRFSYHKFLNFIFRWKFTSRSVGCQKSCLKEVYKPTLQLSFFLLYRRQRHPQYRAQQCHDSPLQSPLKD